jgi:hypothetical protein
MLLPKAPEHDHRLLLRIAGCRHDRGTVTETGDAELTDRQILAQSRYTTAKVLPRYMKRTAKQIATGTKKQRAVRTKGGQLSERAAAGLSERKMRGCRSN